MYCIVFIHIIFKGTKCMTYTQAFNVFEISLPALNGSKPGPANGLAFQSGFVPVPK